MTAYLLRRVAQSALLLVLVTIIAFGLMHLAPGGPLAVYALNPSMRAEDLKRIEHNFGLDRPVYVQYAKWARGMLTGDWGRSYRDSRPVDRVILDRVPATLELTATALVIAVVLGVGIGVLGAVRQYSGADYLATVGAMLALSIPTFWFGLMVIYVFAEQLGWIPAGGRESLGRPFSLIDRLHHLVAPALVLGLVLVATWSRYTRAAMLEVVGQDYVRTARAKGLAEGRVLLGHAFRNAVAPLITLGGIQLPLLFGGALVTESIFSWPGMGRLFVDSLGYRDYPVLMGVLMVTAFLVIGFNLLADVLVALVDPRIRLR
ncbi:MAG TPA: ABC transporter permease [Solirubrobacterales bacterium]|nr:ABC transporter permease [Solirubrobacterales bacterium]